MMASYKYWITVILLASASAIAAPEYKADIPANVTTADSIKTKFVVE